MQPSTLYLVVPADECSYGPFLSRFECDEYAGEIALWHGAYTVESAPVGPVRAPSDEFLAMVRRDRIDENQRRAYRVLRFFGFDACAALSLVRDGSGLEIARRWQKDMRDNCWCIHYAAAHVGRARMFHARNAEKFSQPFADMARDLWKRGYRAGRVAHPAA